MYIIIYKITEMLCALSLVDRCVYVRVFVPMVELNYNIDIT